MNELINDKAVYRTAPATPGLLKVIINFFFLICWCFLGIGATICTGGEV
jgi:hypothetical protein